MPWRGWRVAYSGRASDGAAAPRARTGSPERQDPRPADEPYAARPSDAACFQNDVLQWVASFEATYSRFIPESLIGRINACVGVGWVEVDPETERIFELCEQLVFATHGAFDPTALPLIRLWNWKAEAPVIPNDEAVQAARELVGWSRVQRRQPDGST